QGASASSLESQSEKLEDALEVWIARVKDCGPCHIRPIRQVKVASAGKTENWFISDGSCYLPELTADQAAQAFKIRRESLEKVAMYETQTGGFRQVVEFFPVHPATGRPSNVATLPNPYEAFIAVRGPVLFGVRTSAGYYF